MPKAGVLQFVALAVVLLITIAVFVITIVTYVKVDNNNKNRPSGGGGGGTTVAPPPPKGLTLYNGQFVDESNAWNEDYANPMTNAFQQKKTDYETEVKNSLVAANEGVYKNSYVRITVFRGQHLDAKRTVTVCQFVLGVDSKPSVDTVEADLKWGAQKTNRKWIQIDVETPELPPLPTPGETDGWSKAAKMFLDNMNTSVDPCQDFFRYTCDGYIAKHPLGNQPRTGTFDDLQMAVFKNLTGAFNALEPKGEALKLASNIYKACKKDKGRSNILELANEYGGWPLLKSDWKYDQIPNGIFWTMGSMMTKYGVSTLFTPQVGPDAHKITRHLLYLDQASLAIPADYYNSPNLTEKYQERLRETIYATVKLINASASNDSIIPQIDRIVKIELHLATIMVNSSDQRNMSLGYNQYTVSKAESEFASFEWSPYFKGLLENVFPDDPSALLNPFVMAEPRRYVRDLNEFLSECKKDEGRMRDLVNYLIYRLISAYTRFAGPEMAKIHKQLKRETRLDETEPSGQEMQCVSDLMSTMNFATGRVYIDQFFPPENREDVEVMINNVLSAFSSSLSGLRWMDNPSALKAFRKVAGLVRNVAYPDFQEDDTKLDQYYAWLIDAAKKIDPADSQAYYHYTLNLTEFQSRNMLGQLKKPGDRYEFGSSPAIVNAWYQPIRNSITFPAGILNEPFYRYDFPQAVNYGALGVVMGHELSHGFDDQGVQFDWDGTLQTWMTPLAEEGFKKMAQCVVDEYDQFCYPDVDNLCINGVHTQGENIGDNGGIKAAYRAYQSYSASHGQEKPLPGMETYSMDQIFFLAFANVWCGEYSKDSLTRQLLTNEHSPGKDRVIGAVRNFPKFAEAFKCRQGDPMYPKQACDVW